MDAFAKALNELLVGTFNSILKLEEATLKRISGAPLSINEMHLLETIAQGKQAGRSITDIAKDLAITLPSVTAAVNKLVHKGYVEKRKDDNDKRLVIVTLSPAGRRAEASHRFFHRNMAISASREMPEAEKAVLIQGLTNLRDYFRSQEVSLSQKQGKKPASDAKPGGAERPEREQAG